MSRDTPFQNKHLIEFGLNAVLFDDKGAATIVQCLFCVHKGKEQKEGPGVKRQKTSNTWYYKAPFRPENYRSHLSKNHADEFAKYALLSHAGKVEFFQKHEREGIHVFLDKSSDTLTFRISRPLIIEKVVGDLFFNPEENEEDDDSEAISKANAMKLFKLQDDGSYEITIKNSLRWNLAIQHVSVGLTFRQTALVMTQHRNECKNPKLAGLSDHMVGQFVRVLLGVSLEAIADTLVHSSAWAFSLAADSSNHMGVPLLDQRIRVCISGVLYNLHLTLVPFFERHLAVNYVKLITTILDAMHPHWRDLLLSISSDGENTMTGRNGGVVTLLERQCSNPVLRIWCVTHQLDIVVKNATKGVLDELFYKQAHAFSVHLRIQHNLVTAMGSKCPKDTTRWVAFGSMIKWQTENYRRLLVHIEDKRPVQAPTATWWVIATALVPMFEMFRVTFQTLQARDLVISQQSQHLSIMIADFVTWMDLRPLGELNDIEPSTVVQEGDWFVNKDSLQAHISDQGSVFRDLYQGLHDVEKTTILEEIGKFAIRFVTDASKVQAERDSRNLARELEAPPVMPADIAKLRHSVFLSDVLDPYRGHLTKHWSAEKIDELEKDQRDLVAAYGREAALKLALDGHDEKWLFNEAWDAVKPRFKTLREFCGGLATAFPNTASVESDFSIIKWEKDAHRTSLTSLSLAGIMHSKQFSILKDISKLMT